MANAGNRGFSFPEQRSGMSSGQSGKVDSGVSGLVETAKDKAKDLASSASELTSQAKDKAKDFASSASEFTSHARDKAQEFASSVASQAGTAWDSTKHEAQELASSVATGAEDAFDSATTFIRRYPVPSLFMAFGLGFIAAEALKGLSGPDRSRYPY